MGDLLPGTLETIERNIARILEYVSPSQVDAFELCERRWYNQSVLGWREPETPAMARGTSIGKDAEDFYVSRGQKPPSGPHAALVTPVLAILGAPHPGITVEKWLELPTFEGGPRVRGRYDFYDPSPKVRLLGQPAMPKLSDIKSRSKRAYFKKVDPKAPEGERIDSDLQLNMYGRAKLVETGEPAIAVGHAYTLTSGKPKAEEVLFVATMENTEPRWFKTVESVRRMTRWARERPATADPLPPNTAACTKYPPLGCPHRTRCGFDGLAGALAIERQNPTNRGDQTMPEGPSLMDRLNQMKSELTGGAPPPAAVAPQGGLPPLPAAAAAPSLPPLPAAAPASPPPAAAAAPSLPPLPAQQAAPSVDLGFCPKCGTPQTGDNTSKLRDGSIFHVGCPKAQSVAAPVAPSLPPLPAQTNGAQPIRPPDAPPATSTPEEIAAAAEPKKRKTKAKAPEAEAPPQAAATLPPLPDPAHVDTARRSALEAPNNGAGGGGGGEIALWRDASALALGAAGPVIYIDCFPVKGPHRNQIVHFEEWMRPICEEVARKKGVVDWRLIQYTAKGDLAAEVRGVLSTLPPVVHVSKFAPAADVFLECVVPHAAQIVRGI